MSPTDLRLYIYEAEKESSQLGAKTKGDNQKKDVHVCHAAPQTRLQRLWVETEQPHHSCPAQRRKGRPGVLSYLGKLCLVQAHQTLTAVSAIGSTHQAIIARRLCSKLRQSQHHSREDVNYDLLIYTTARALPMPKDPVPTKQT